MVTITAFDRIVSNGEVSASFENVHRLFVNFLRSLFIFARVIYYSSNRSDDCYFRIPIMRR